LKFQWMGRYRELLRALVLHSNNTARLSSIIMDVGGVAMTPYEWQVFECILEHEDENVNMISMSNSLGVPQSTFSKVTKKLCKHGLVERYQALGNRKNIILKGSEMGRELYLAHVGQVMEGVFRPLFDALDDLPDEAIETFVTALNRFNRRNDSLEPRLTPVPQDPDR